MSNSYVFPKVMQHTVIYDKRMLCRPHHFDHSPHGAFFGQYSVLDVPGLHVVDEGKLILTTLVNK